MLKKFIIRIPLGSSLQHRAAHQKHQMTSLRNQIQYPPDTALQKLHKFCVQLTGDQLTDTRSIKKFIQLQ